MNRNQFNQPILPFAEFLQQLQNMNVEHLSAQLPDVLPPLVPIQLDGNRTILSPTMPQRYLVRQIGMGWYRSMEDVFDNVPVGTRILVRSNRSFSPVTNQNIITDYITTRMGHQTFLGYWTHQDVAYGENEVSPYPFDMDAYHQRDVILSNHMNNQNVPEIALPQEGLNPLGEGQMMDQNEENRAALFLQSSSF